jgi:hypothetical protein
MMIVWPRDGEGATPLRVATLGGLRVLLLAIEPHTFGLVTPRQRSLEEYVENRIASG